MAIVSIFIHLKPVPTVLWSLKSLFGLFSAVKSYHWGLLRSHRHAFLYVSYITLLLIRAVAFSHLIHFLHKLLCKNLNQATHSSFRSIFSMGLVYIFSSLIINTLTLWNHLPDRGLFILYGIILSLMVICSFYRKCSDEMLLKYLYGAIGAPFFWYPTTWSLLYKVYETLRQEWAVFW